MELCYVTKRNIQMICVYNSQTISKMAVPMGDSTANEVAR